MSVKDNLVGGLEKVAEVTGTLTAVLFAVAFLLFFGLGNPITHFRLDPNFQFSNWMMNGIGFLMFFVLAFIANRANGHAQQASIHANEARIHAGHARRQTNEIHAKLQTVSIIDNSGSIVE